MHFCGWVPAFPQPWHQTTQGDLDHEDSTIATTAGTSKTDAASTLLALALLTSAGATVGGAAVGAGAGAAIGAGTGHGAGRGALIGTGIGAAAGAVYDITR